ncbi:MAG: hypothetical protein RIC19_25120 [Phaeodactylibacter sp.]|uniref:hypothetical protein n=1 Tax=Phaeodactylibacter sp. TaxID=1940289 RepID=UPI0032EEE1FC
MTQKVQLELYFWIFTVLVTSAVMLPILTSVPGYPFTFVNIVYVVVAITLTRYIFLLKHTFLARRQNLKVVVVFLCIPLVFYLVQNLNYFQTFLDEEGPEAIIGKLAYTEQQNLLTYIRSELLLFGVMSIISSVLLPLRLILSVWRTRNRGTV